MKGSKPSSRASWRRFVSLVVLGLLLVSLAPQASIGASDSTGSYFVRISESTLPQAQRLGLQPRLDLDYGSYHWLELTQSDFATLSASDAPFTRVADAGDVQVTRYRFDPLAEGQPALPAGMTAPSEGPGLRLVQFFGPTQDAWLAQLEALGLTVLQYYPHYAYLVWGTGEQAAAAAALSAVRWQGLFHPAYKINADLNRRSGRIQNVDIFFYNDGDIQATLDAIAALGGNVLQHYPAQPDRAFYDAIVEMDADAIDDVARLNTVLWLGYASPEPVLDDEMSSQIVAGNHPSGVPVTGYFDHLASLGFDGSGVTWAIVDTGVDYQHPDLGPHIVGGYSFPGACDPPGEPGSDCSGGGHGTHVGGIVGGDASAGYTDGNGFLYGLGVAPAYGIFAMNSLSAFAWPPSGGWQEHSKRAVLGAAIGGNNSWTTGEGTRHGYQTSERTHDIMVRDGNFDTASVAEPFIEVFSAGNSGSSGLTAPKEGKNLIVTASSRNYRAGDIDAISSFSSRGPAVDGRWVPTIAAPGETIASARNDLGGSCSSPISGTDGLYAYCSGTSMAAPHTSGSIVLITEWWRSFNSGADPSPAMAKALLVNGAVDMATPDIPNINEGWGRINFTNVIDPGVGAFYRDQIDVFDASGEQFTLQFGVDDPAKPLKVTLAWSDAPGAVGANPALVNDLNLTLSNGGNTYLGNVFSGGWSDTGGAADTINNLENVYIQTPSAGVATITVDAINVSGDGIPYNADPTDQDFVLVCYNCILAPDFTLQVTPAAQDICAPDAAAYSVDIGSLLGFDDPVTLSASGEPAGTSVGFSVNPVIPPGASQLTIGNTAAASGGSYSIEVVGSAPPLEHNASVQLNLFTAVPAAPGLISPADGATNVSVTPTFEWSAVTGATSYSLQVATDAAFGNVVYTATETGTTHTMATALDNGALYYWRITAENVCGAGSPSATFSFTTAAGGCVATVALEESGTGKSDLATLRQFRDQVLASSATGQQYIDLYYEHSPELMWMLLKDAELRARTATVLAEFMPGIRSLLGQADGRELLLTAARVERVQSLVDEFAERGSPELGAALTEIANDIASHQGKPLRAMWLAGSR